MGKAHSRWRYGEGETTLVSMKLRWILGWVMLAAMLGGCATTYRFKVDALASKQGDGTGRRFVIEEPTEGRPGSRLRYREAADFVSRALISRGWELANDPSEAEMVISLAAKVSDPLTDTERRMEPVYYRTWGQTHVVRTPVFDQDGKRVGAVATRVYIPPQTRFAGFYDYDRSIIVYEKSLELSARSPGGEELWTLSVRTIDQSSDLRSYIPLLAAAALPYIGETTDGAVGVSLREDDESVQYLRQRGPA